MKKILFASISFLLLGLAVNAVAAENFVPLAGIPGLTQDVPVTSAGLAGFFNNLYKYLIGLAAALAVIQITWSGIRIAFHQDSVSSIIDGKKNIMQAILGLVLVLSPTLVFSIINPNILNLSVSLPPLDTATSTTNGSGGSSTTGTNTVPGGNPNFASLTPEQQAACIGYSEFKIVQVPQNQYCKDVLGTGWVSVSDFCSGTSVPLGSGVCGLVSAQQSQTSGCVVTGEKGILEIATCPSAAMATQWGQSCSGRLTPIFTITKDSSGNVTKAGTSCEGSKPYMFIDTRTSDFTTPISGLQPLARSADRPNNGADASRFVAICQSAWKANTCITNLPSLTFESTCSPQAIDIPGGATGKCYKEDLYCTTAGIGSSVITYVSKCAANPAWVAWTKFK
jgi:hypothetical protein